MGGSKGSSCLTIETGVNTVAAGPLTVSGSTAPAAAAEPATVLPDSGRVEGGRGTGRILGRGRGREGESGIWRKKGGGVSHHIRWSSSAGLIFLAPRTVDSTHTITTRGALQTLIWWRNPAVTHTITQLLSTSLFLSCGIHYTLLLRLHACECMYVCTDGARRSGGAGC